VLETNVERPAKVLARMNERELVDRRDAVDIEAGWGRCSLTSKMSAKSASSWRMRRARIRRPLKLAIVKWS
jgi:hypothetical protein